MFYISDDAQKQMVNLERVLSISRSGAPMKIYFHTGEYNTVFLYDSEESRDRAWNEITVIMSHIQGEKLK